MNIKFIEPYQNTRVFPIYMHEASISEKLRFLTKIQLVFTIQSHNIRLTDYGYRYPNYQRNLKRGLTLKTIHHLADITQTSSAFWVFLCTLTIAQFLFPLNLFHDRGMTISKIILLDIRSRIVETITY